MDEYELYQPFVLVCNRTLVFGQADLYGIRHVQFVANRLMAAGNVGRDYAIATAGLMFNLLPGL
jgi:hypothetical protein